MDIYATFANMKDAPYVLEFIVAWDEYSIDSNPEGYAEDVRMHLASFEDQLLRSVTVKITVSSADEFRIIDALNPTIDIQATVRIEKNQ